jgi:hypothetical protein
MLEVVQRLAQLMLVLAVLRVVQMAALTALAVLLVTERKLLLEPVMELRNRVRTAQHRRRTLARLERELEKLLPEKLAQMPAPQQPWMLPSRDLTRLM